MISGLETFLLQRVGAALAKKALADLRKPSFSKVLEKRIRRSNRTPRLSFGQRAQLRQLLRTEETWGLLFDRRQVGIDELAVKIRASVLAGSRADTHEAAEALAVTAQNETPGALDLQDFAVLLVAEIRDVGDKVDEQGGKIDQVLHRLAGPDHDAGQHLAGVATLGPLLALGLADKAEAAKAQQESDPASALKLLDEVVDSLQASGLTALARPYQRDRAGLLLATGDVDRACAALLLLARADIDDGASLEARWASEKHEELIRDGRGPSWLPARAKALDLIREWFSNPGIDAAALASALADVASSGDPDAAWLVAAGSECLLVDRSLEQVLSIGGHLEVLSATTDELTRIRLLACLAEAHEDESRWKSLLSDASLTSARLTAGSAALVYARRGRYLFWKSQSGADEQYANAVAMASYDRLWQDVARWMYAQWRATADDGPFDEGKFSLPGRANSIRVMGTGSLLGRRYDAEAAGLEYRMQGKLASALSEFRRALRDAVRLGHVEDELTNLGWLGELYRHSAEPAWALTAFILAGNAKESEATANAYPSIYFDLRAHAMLDRPQSVAAALLAAATEADRIPDEHVADWVRLALRAIHQTSRSIFGPQAWVEGYKVLAALAERIPADLVDDVLAVVTPVIPREEGRYTLVDDQLTDILDGLAVAVPERKNDLVPLIREAMGASFAMHRALVHGDAVSLWFVDFAADLRLKAQGGDADSTVALCLNDDDDPQTIAAAEATVDRVLASGPAYGENVVSFMASVDLPAHVASRVDDDRRHALARTYCNDATDAMDVESNRAQAARACGILASGLSLDVRKELLQALLPIARGEYDRSEMEPGPTHPLSAFQFRVASGDLRRQALLACAQLASTQDESRPVALAGLSLARSGQVSDVRAAVSSWYRLANEGFDLPLSMTENALSSDVARRQLAAAMVAGSENLDPEIVIALARDEQMAVRREVAQALAPLAERDATLAEDLRLLLLADPSYAVRRAAQVGAEE